MEDIISLEQFILDNIKKLSWGFISLELYLDSLYLDIIELRVADKNYSNRYYLYYSELDTYLTWLSLYNEDRRDAIESTLFGSNPKSLRLVSYQDVIYNLSILYEKGFIYIVLEPL